MIVKLLTEHHLEFLRLKEGCRGSSESTQVNMRYCWKAHALAQLLLLQLILSSLLHTSYKRLFNSVLLLLCLFSQNKH